MDLAIGLVEQHAFEAISILIAAAALVYAALAFKAAKQAVQATRDSDMTALRVKVQDGISGAARSLLKLQKACQSTRDGWKKHRNKRYPTLGNGLGRADETRHIGEIERAGSKLLRELHSSAPKTGKENAVDLEGFTKKAHSASVQIERLKFGLEAPKPLQR